VPSSQLPGYCPIHWGESSRLNQSLPANQAYRSLPITNLKDGRSALAYKVEQAVDMETGAIVAVTTYRGAAADNATIAETLCEGRSGGHCGSSAYGLVFDYENDIEYFKTSFS
jgi:hypothetical protein